MARASVPLIVVAALALAPAVARAGDASALAAVDVFHADSVNPGPGAGSPDFVAAQELGLTLRLQLHELDDRLQVRLLYRGREPLPGEVQNVALRTLYEAWIGWELWQDTVTVRAGRFLVPSPIFLALDGAEVKLELPLGFETTVFGGRRGITSSRREAGIDKWLLAGGGSVGWHHELVETALHVNYAQDEGVFLKAGQESLTPIGGFNLLGTVFSRPFDWLLLGAQLAFVQQATYVIGPTWNTVTVENQVLNLLNATAWTEWRPLKLVRVSYDFHFQRPGAVRSGTVAGENAALTEELVDPNFMDNRLKLAVSPFAIGWFSGGVRHRLRPERHELRYFADLDINHLIPWGFYGNGQIIYEQILHNPDVTDPKEMDRILGSLAVGWTGFGFDASTGVSYIERAGAPLSNRSAQAATPSDLSPFVLEAQRLLFVRFAYNSRWFFTAVDFERNIDDNEYRAFAQVGGNMELSW